MDTRFPPSVNVPNVPSSKSSQEIMAQSELKLSAPAVEGHAISAKLYDGAALTLGLDEGTRDGTLFNEGDALGIALGAALAEGEEFGTNDGAPLILGFDEGTSEGTLLNEGDELGMALGSPLNDGEELGTDEGAALTLGRDKGMTEGKLLKDDDALGITLGDTLDVG
jgi:hypothetical protein